MSDQLKWRVKLVDSSTTDPWLFSNDRTSAEDVTRPIGHDRAKVMTWKGKAQVVKMSFLPQ
jgi:hypothetical protein